MLRTDKVFPLPYPHNSPFGISSTPAACTLGESDGKVVYRADPNCPGCMAWVTAYALSHPFDHVRGRDKVGKIYDGPLWKMVQLEFQEYGYELLLVHFNKALYKRYPELKECYESS